MKPRTSLARRANKTAHRFRTDGLVGWVDALRGPPSEFRWAAGRRPPPEGRSPTKTVRLAEPRTTRRDHNHESLRPLRRRPAHGPFPVQIRHGRAPGSMEGDV